MLVSKVLLLKHFLDVLEMGDMDFSLCILFRQIKVQYLVMNSLQFVTNNGNTTN